MRKAVPGNVIMHTRANMPRIFTVKEVHQGSFTSEDGNIELFSHGPYCFVATGESVDTSMPTLFPEQTVPLTASNSSGSKYLRELKCLVDGKADVYTVTETFDVRCPARVHAIKKLLCSGLRGKGDTLQDLNEARDAITRAIQMEESRRDRTREV